MNPAAASRQRVGLFALTRRGLVEVRGADRVRFLQGQLSNDVAALEPGAGCYALLLTPQGRIVADLHLLMGEPWLWLETARGSVGAALERLARYVIADDVELIDRSDDFARFAIEGPAARAVLEEVGGGAEPPPREGWAELEIAGTSVRVGAWGVSGEAAFQLFVPSADAAAVHDALRDAVASHGGVRADEDDLETLRVEAGTPGSGSELNQDVLPAESGLLARAVSFTKGCYTGQEVVARMASRGRHAHELIGLRWEDGEAPPAPGAAVEVEGKRVGNVTSTAISPAAGAIGLAYVRRADAAPGTGLRAGGRPAQVVALPFVAPGDA